VQANFQLEPRVRQRGETEGEIGKENKEKKNGMIG
jgi:hypothetical protein